MTRKRERAAQCIEAAELTCPLCGLGWSACLLSVTPGFIKCFLEPVRLDTTTQGKESFVLTLRCHRQQEGMQSTIRKTHFYVRKTKKGAGIK